MLRRLAVLAVAVLLVPVGLIAFQRAADRPAVARQQPFSEAATGRVAYIRQGDLWVRDLPAGPARRLTTDGRNGEPQWSPSGQWIKVRKDGEFWLIRADGAAAHSLLPGRGVTAAAWAPAADRIAYSDARGRIGVVRPDGFGDKVVFAPGPDERAGSPAWSPDGRWIAFGLDRGPPPGRKVHGIWRVPAAGGRAEELYALHEVPPCLGLVGWTPDGQAVLFRLFPMCSNSIAADGLPLLMQPVASGEPHTLVDHMLVHRGFLVAAPTGQLAAVAGGGRQTWTQKRILVVHPATRQSTFVSPAEMAAISPAWSPDGTHLAYIAMSDIGPVGGGESARQGLMKRRVWIAQPDGSGRRQLTADPGYRDEAPRWTADGGHILFVRFNAEGQASLWLVGVRDAQPEVVAQVGTVKDWWFGPAEWWFGYYGWIGAGTLYDYWPGPARS